MNKNGNFSSFETRRRRTKLITKLIVVLVIAAIIAIPATAFTFRFDWAAGSHRITPTAVDQDFWGNYQVYYRTSVITQNNDEDFYYIQKGEEALVAAVQEAIKTNSEIMVFYDRWVGFKGFGSPESSPIIRIEPVGGDN